MESSGYSDQLVAYLDLYCFQKRNIPRPSLTRVKQSAAGLDSDSMYITLKNHEGLYGIKNVTLITVLFEVLLFSPCMFLI